MTRMWADCQETGIRSEPNAHISTTFRLHVLFRVVVTDLGDTQGVDRVQTESDADQCSYCSSTSSSSSSSSSSSPSDIRRLRRVTFANLVEYIDDNSVHNDDDDDDDVVMV